MVVMHSCDNPLCVNPAHLQLGTQLENIHDRDRKGRQVANHPAGELNGMAKLTGSSVMAIKALVEHGALHADLAAIFGVSRAAISGISSGRRWADI